MRRTLQILALVSLGYVAGVTTPPVVAQVANLQQRQIRAEEAQAKSLQAIARSLASIERKMK
jgi:hypothetical protein